MSSFTPAVNLLLRAACRPLSTSAQIFTVPPLDASRTSQSGLSGFIFRTSKTSDHGRPQREVTHFSIFLTDCLDPEYLNFSPVFISTPCNLTLPLLWILGLPQGLDGAIPPERQRGTCCKLQILLQIHLKHICLNLNRNSCHKKNESNNRTRLKVLIHWAIAEAMRTTQKC